MGPAAMLALLLLTNTCYFTPMSKIKTAFFCNNCGYESTKWIGKCPSCNEWNTFTQEVIHSGDAKEKTTWEDYPETKKITKNFSEKSEFL